MGCIVTLNLYQIQRSRMKPGADSWWQYNQALTQHRLILWPFLPIAALKPKLMSLEMMQKQPPHCSHSGCCWRISWSATMWRRFLKFHPTYTTHLHLKANSSLCRQRLKDDGQFSGSPGSRYTSFWHFDTVACLRLLNSCTHARLCICSTSKSRNSLTPQK